MAQQKNHFDNVLIGTLLGAFSGAGIGLGVFMCISDGVLFFPGDTILIGALTCGWLGYYLGDGFIEWLKENCIYFWL